MRRTIEYVDPWRGHTDPSYLSSSREQSSGAGACVALPPGINPATLRAHFGPAAESFHPLAVAFIFPCVLEPAVHARVSTKFRENIFRPT